MLSVAGFSAYAWSWKVGIAVAVVMLTVVTSYRQTVHAYPSGGGDYEVATVNLGRNAGITVASALIVDYVLTVAVSISSGAQYAASAIGPLRGHEATVATVMVIFLTAMNLRGVRESGTFFAVPTYAFMVAILGMCGFGLLRLLVRRPARRRERRPRDHPAEGWGDPLTTFGLTILLARAFSSGCAALTGVEAISNGVPAFQRPKSRNAATTLLLLGTDRGHDDAERHHAGPADEPEVRRPARARPAPHRHRRGPAGGLRPAPGDLADRRRRLRRLRTGVLLRRDRDRDHPGAGRQHRLQRLPRARLDPRPGRARTPGAGLARRPAGLQQRHRLPGGAVDHPDPGLRRRDHPADPALHRRGVRLVQPQPARDDPALDPAPEGHPATPPYAGG